MAELKDIVQEEIAWYAADGLGANVRFFKLFDEAHQTYAIAAVDYPARKAVAGIVVLVRIVGDVTVIEEDATDRPVEQRLIKRGIPREKIVLAYRGESVPDPVQIT